MTLCNSYNSMVFTLSFSGTSLGDSVHTLQASFQRLTQVAQRHNFWATNVLLDGGYPALVYEHTFVIYKEAAGRVEYVDYFYDLANQIVADPQELLLKAGGNNVFAFGDCYLANTDQKEPSDLLMLAAGMSQLTFWGTVIPSLC